MAEELPEQFILHGYAGHPFPGGSDLEAQAWAEGVWTRQGELMPKPRMNPLPRPLKKPKKEKK